MATITPGTGATINATTIEGQLFQLIHFINNAENSLGGDTNNFSLDKDEEGILTSTFKLSGQFLFTPATGIFTESTIPYLASVPFSPGTPLGTIKSITLAQYFIDCVSYAVIWQNNLTKNPQKVIGATLNFAYNSEPTYTGNISLPYITTLSAGGITETATEWLLT